MIFIVKDKGEIYLASKHAGLKLLMRRFRLRSRSAEVRKVIQRSSRSRLTIDAADIAGLISGKVNYYVGKLSVTQIPLSMKLSRNLVMSHRKTGLRMLSNNMPDCQPGTTIENLSRLRWWMFRRKLNFLFFRLSVYLSIRALYENLQSMQLLENHVGDDKVTLMFLL